MRQAYADRLHRPLQRSVLPLCPIQIASEPLSDPLPVPTTAIRPVMFRDTQVHGAGLAMGWMRLRDRMEFTGTGAHAEQPPRDRPGA